VQDLPKIRINLPGRHCQCGALRVGKINQRCEKCQARSSWYRHNCRRPRRAASRAPGATIRKDAETRARGQRSAEES
jgi:hypothetical protein